MEILHILSVIPASALFSLVYLSQPIESKGKNRPRYRKATFAGGCFWCMERPFENLDGVISVVPGYTAGETEDPSYQDYSQGGHIEAVEVEYDPEVTPYGALLDVFWRQIDPTDPGGQFVDRGRAYSTAIFYHDDDQRVQAGESKERLADKGLFGKAIVTPVLPASTFYPAEDYHQGYHKKNPVRYKFYRRGSGRDRFLDRIWGEQRGPAGGSADDSRKELTPMQYRVTQKEATEPPFQNEYWDNKRDGIYVDIVSGEALFSSTDKFDSGTGWPSFSRPLVAGNVVEKVDRKLFVSRVEVRSKLGDSHLGHVFRDGPPPARLRYCINSAALRFVPADEMVKGGYGEFGDRFGGPGRP